MADKGCVMLVGEVDGDGGLAATTAELVTLGKEISSAMACPFAAVLFGDAVREAGAQLAAMGPDEVFLLESPSLGLYGPEQAVAAVKAALAGRGASVLLLSNSPMGQDLAPRLAFDLGAGLMTDCVGFELEEGELLCTRPVYGGNVMAACVSRREVLVATVRQHAFEAAQAQGGAGTVTDLAPELPEPAAYRALEVISEKSDDVDLEDAAVVVSGGRGIGGREGFEELAELARMLGGAVGASRPPVDSGWIQTTAQVGITGKIVAPDVYIAIGLSGSSQHLTGMSDSRTVVAINNDPDAYIFKVSDYGVVGDWRAVLPAFRAKLAGLTGPREG